MHNSILLFVTYSDTLNKVLAKKNMAYYLVIPNIFRIFAT
ncbi:hypothetical protein SAMN05216462_1202 [Xylanibacter ruminicola]|uniref:Uncharacterized protein n=1 Tax=Xylanibacter ruminicola TaxID=839 RepID=A0A1H4AFJ4_XYLRU|nr:hypothetical protein SAMN05216462_1202 [Xylanibacter ruminicola]